LGNKRQVPTRIIVVKRVTVDEKPATSQG